MASANVQIENNINFNLNFLNAEKRLGTKLCVYITGPFNMCRKEMHKIIT